MHIFSVSGPPDRAATAFRPVTWACSGAEERWWAPGWASAAP